MKNILFIAFFILLFNSCAGYRTTQITTNRINIGDRKEFVLKKLGKPFKIDSKKESDVFYYKEVVDLERTEEQALAIARLQSKQALQQNWADFELLARKEDFSVEESTLHYRVVYTITADICK